jgi:aminoglycoside 6-adenylyltransferase
MDPKADSYQRLIDKFLAWAGTEDNIRAAFVIGSQARTDHPADEWADLDLFILARDSRKIWESAGWLRNIGVPWITFVEQTPDGRGFERRTLFEGGLDVDFAPMDADAMRKTAVHGVPPDMADVLRRGVRTILDKDGFAALIPAFDAEAPAVPPPVESEFLGLVNDYWYHAVWTAKHLRRGELWWANSCCDMRLANLLRRMMEWHARAKRGPKVDTWMRGRFLEEWADPKAVTALRSTFAHYDEEDVWRALRASMDLFHDLGAETAALLHFSYPAQGEEKARELVEAMYSGRKRSPAV